MSACSSAGICMAVAGAMHSGGGVTAIEQLPDTTGMKSEVVIQTGHLVNYGHPITQDIRLAGARVVAFGAVNSVSEAQLAGAIGGIRPRRFTSSAITARRTGRSPSPISPASAANTACPSSSCSRLNMT